VDAIALRGAEGKFGLCTLSHRAWYRPDNRGRTVLHLAVLEGSVALIHFLIEHGADASARDDGGRSLLHRAVQKGSFDLVRVLIVHGADVTAEDDYGLTPIDWTVQERREDHFQFLVEHFTQYVYCQLRRTRHRFRSVS